MEVIDWTWVSIAAATGALLALAKLAWIIRINHADRAWSEAFKKHEFTGGESRRQEAADRAHDDVISRNAWAHMARTVWNGTSSGLRHAPAKGRLAVVRTGLSLWYTLTGGTDPSSYRARAHRKAKWGAREA
ncbi:MAG: hypothetical protein OXG35_16870 [Acidobacteria bacterium]|nr:hypothetical protein [Acidobacteriota bacterium]